MEMLPCQGCKGMCCGPVPVTEQELRTIRKKIKSMPAKAREQLENQTRYRGTCMFYDIDHDKCGIYSARPAICRVFGLHKNLVCFRKPEAATLGNWNAAERPVATLSIDVTWRDFR